VKKLDNDMKVKNQNTKYTISGKEHSANMKKITSQNSCFLNKSSYKENNHALHFPNRMPMHLEISRKDKDLHKRSSRSIKLSRKANLPQMRHDGLRYDDKFAIMPKIEARISNDTRESHETRMSLLSQSSYDTTDTVSTSILSVPNLKMETKEVFANIPDKGKSISKITLNQLQSVNSECEINVLHYENDISSENCIAHFMQRRLKSIKASSSNSDNSSPINIQDNNNNIIDEENRVENSYRWNISKIPNIKYSWEVDTWMPFPQKKEYNDIHGIKRIGIYNKKPYECKIKYSWQVIGISTQTSRSLLQDLLDNGDINNSSYKICTIKYSWQIIGIGTQASLHDNDPDYWNGTLLSPNKNCDKSDSQIDNNKTDCAKSQEHIKCGEGGFRRYLILNNRETQTFAEKEVQVDIIDYNAKYSWHNLIKQYV